MRESSLPALIALAFLRGIRTAAKDAPIRTAAIGTVKERDGKEALSAVKSKSTARSNNQEENRP